MQYIIIPDARKEIIPRVLQTTVSDGLCMPNRRVSM